IDRASSDFPDEAAAVRTAADGTFTLDAVASGELDVFAQTASRGSAQVHVALGAGEDRDLLLVLGEGATLSGRARFPDGRPAAGAAIAVDMQAPVATAAADGSFRLIGVRPGYYGVTARVPGRPPSPSRVGAISAG